MSFFGLNFGQNAEIDIVLDNQDERRMGELKDENGRKERLFLFYDGESVTGKVNVTLHRKTNRLEHQGIKIEFIGQIEVYYDRGTQHEFLSLVKQLAGPGELTQNTAYEFEFNQVEKSYESYTGANVRLRYFLRVTVIRRLTDLTKELDLLVHTLATYPEMNNPIKMEVGIEECLHIEFEYNKSKYHLKDVIVGKIYFLLVRIKIKHMEVAIIKRETTGSGPNTFHDNETIAKYEIMDGAPVKGESIPIRVFLAGYDLTPTMRDVNKKFSVKYYLNLVLVDEEERRYFKQQEITLWRKGDRIPRKSHLGAAGAAAYPAQVPHAMARHVAGDMPSQNVRTAPTPSEPNTPIYGNGNEFTEDVRERQADEDHAEDLDDDLEAADLASKEFKNASQTPPMREEEPELLAHGSTSANDSNTNLIQSLRINSSSDGEAQAASPEAAPAVAVAVTVTAKANAPISEQAENKVDDTPRLFQSSPPPMDDSPVGQEDSVDLVSDREPSDEDLEQEDVTEPPAQHKSPRKDREKKPVAATT